MFINFDSFVFFTLVLYALGSLTSKSLLSLAGSFAVVAVIWALVSKKLSLSHITVCGLLWVGFTVANLLLRPLQDHGLSSLGRIPIFLIPLLGLCTLGLTNKRRQRILQMLVVASTAAMLKSLHSVFFLHQPGAGFFGNPIYCAYATLPVVVYFFEMFLARSVHLRWAAVGILVSLAGLMLTGSRMAVLFALAFVGLRSLYLFSRRGRPALAWALFGTLCAIFAAMVRLVPFINEKFTRLFDSQDPSRVWRLVAWRYNLSEFTKHPLLGLGFENNGIDTAVKTDLAGHWAPGHLIYAHSIYFQWLAEGGLIGTALAVLYFALMARQGRMVFWVVFALAVSGVTENVLTNFAPLYGFMFIAALAQIRPAQAHPEN